MVSRDSPNSVGKALSEHVPAQYSPLEKTPHKARVVRDGLMPAANALIAMPAECGRAATRDCAEQFELGPRERIAITLEELVACPADDIGHLPGWSGHG